MILDIFSNVDMRLGHPGLLKLCRERKITQEKMAPGQYVVFVNASRNKMKMLNTDQIMTYLRLPKNRRVDLTILKDLPSYFRGETHIYDKLVEKKIAKAFDVKTMIRQTKKSAKPACRAGNLINLLDKT